MQWQDTYKARMTDIDSAVSLIQSGNDVIVAQCASEPQGCMSRFHIVADRVEDVRVFSVLTLKPYDFYMKPEMKGHFELASWFHAPGSREALKAGTGHGDLRAEHAPPGRDRPDPGAPARHLLRHLHAARPARLRVALARHHLREGHHRGRTDRGARGEPPPARAPSATRTCTSPRCTASSTQRPGGARAARALALGHGPRHRGPRRRAGRGRLARSSSASAASPTRSPSPCGTSTTSACTPR